MGRPRGKDDAELLAAAMTVMGEVGPAGFTLAAVARRAGVAPATLVQRFGSKRGLVIAMSRAHCERLGAVIREAAAGQPDALAALRTAALATHRFLDDPELAPNHLAQLGVDLGDAQLRELLGYGHRVIAGELAGLVERAVGAGELTAAPPAGQAARIIAALVDGAALDWSISPRGSLLDRLTEDLDAVLGSWK